ncbi:MAG: hypothetical protein AB1716_02440 [Planctomycetota bacterium]
MAESQDRAVGSARWARWTQRGAARVARLLAEAGEVSPTELARAVAASLPRRAGRWLLRRLAQRGWLERDRVIPFDVLDGPDCPPEFAGRRGLVRLALFGPGGQGVPYREKHRQEVYHQLCAEIMSGAVDLVSLQAIASRALNHSDVITDPVLNSMIRAFIAQRESVLRTRPRAEVDREESEQSSKLRAAFDVRARCEFPTKEELVMAFGRLQREFDACLAQFEEVRALQVLERMRALRGRFPVHIPAAELQRCEEQLDKLGRRAGNYRRQLRELAEQGAAAAQAGDTVRAAWVVRRLQAVHRLLPNLLPHERLTALVGTIERSGEVHETQEAARELLDRQRAIAAKVRELAGVIHRFHELAQKLPPEHNAYRRAELSYKRALNEIRQMDTAWLTSLMLELETLLDDLDDPTGELHTQFDQFIARVRTALNRLCLEIRAHQRRPSSGPGATPPPAPPPNANGPPATDGPRPA